MKNVIFCLILFLLAITCPAQTFLNGSFEFTSDTCGYGVSNAHFDSVMSNVHAYGPASQIDIMNYTCGFGPAQQGEYFLGLASVTTTDALALKLDSDLIASETYRVSFYQRRETVYISSDIEIGYSADSGITVIAVDTVPDAPDSIWRQYSVVFTPQYPARFITVRPVNGFYNWTLVDDFTLSKITGIKENAEEVIASVYPDPATEYINIVAGRNDVFKEAVICNSVGQYLIRTESELISLNQLPAGIYLIKIITANGHCMKRFVHY